MHQVRSDPYAIRRTPDRLGCSEHGFPHPHHLEDHLATSTKTQTKVRTFLRAVTSEHYGLKEFRRAQLAAPRVRGDDVVTDDASVGHSEKSKTSRGWWRLGPGDEQFLTQTLQVHFVEIAAGGANKGHGHQNEAVFYILQGSGYEIHDDQRYDWNKDDAVVVHTDSVHGHASNGGLARTLVFQAKSLDVLRADPAGQTRAVRRRRRALRPPRR